VEESILWLLPESIDMLHRRLHTFLYATGEARQSGVAASFLYDLSGAMATGHIRIEIVVLHLRNKSL
jgi:hypothetical protein